MDILPQFIKILPWMVLVQGLLLAAVVLSKHRYKSNRYFGTFLIMLSFHGLNSLTRLTPESYILSELFVAFGCMPFLYGPLIYRYVWHSLYRNWDDPVKFVFHSIPAAANFLLYLMIYILTGRKGFMWIIRSVFEGKAPAYVWIIEWAKVLHGIFYVGLIIRLIYRQRRGLKRLASEKTHRKWLTALLAVFGMNWVLVFISAIVLQNGKIPSDADFLFTVLKLAAFLAFLYTAAFFAVRFPVILEPREAREEIRKRLRLTEEFIAETLRRLEAAEKKRFFNNPEITLPSLAGDLGLHPNALSYIINETKEQGFREYLNSLRIEDFILRVDSDEYGRSLLEHALASGFSSKSTFLRAFRAMYSSTPQEYLLNRGVGFHTAGTNTHTETS